jgi:hypothetical protein
MLLLITLVLAFIPLLGVLWIFISGSFWTVDGLFMTLILLTMSGVVGMNALFELRKGSRGWAGSRRGALAVAGGLLERGKVDNVVFYEAVVGQPNKSLVTLSDGAQASRLLVFSGDLRNSLPVGKKVEITYRQDQGAKVLLQVSYI